jgi:hypothetical protein
MLISEKEAARLLGVSLSVMRKWRSIKKGPPWYKLEGAIRYNSEELKVWVESKKEVK